MAHSSQPPDSSYFSIPSEIHFPVQYHVKENDRETEVETWIEFPSNNTVWTSDSDTTTSLRLHQLASPARTKLNRSELGQMVEHDYELKTSHSNGTQSGGVWVEFLSHPSCEWDSSNTNGPVNQRCEPEKAIEQTSDMANSKCVESTRQQVPAFKNGAPCYSTSVPTFDDLEYLMYDDLQADEEISDKPDIPLTGGTQKPGTRWWAGVQHAGIPVHAKLEAMHHQASKPVKATLSAVKVASEPVVASLLAAKEALMAPIRSCLTADLDGISDEETGMKEAIPKEVNSELRRPSLTTPSLNAETREEVDSRIGSHCKPASIIHGVQITTECPQRTEVIFKEKVGIPEGGILDFRPELRDVCSNETQPNSVSCVSESPLRNSEVSCRSQEPERERVGDSMIASKIRDYWAPSRWRENRGSSESQDCSEAPPPQFSHPVRSKNSFNSAHCRSASEISTVGTESLGSQCFSRYNDSKDLAKYGRFV